MRFNLKKIAALTAISASATLAIAEEVSTQSDVVDILAGKPVYTLGPAKIWTAGDQSYTFITADLAKLTQVPTNTSNIYLYPENGALNTEENRTEVGIQGFYVDLGEAVGIGSVSTTWERAAASAYDIYVTNEVPTLEILSTTPTYSASGLGDYTDNTAAMPEKTKGRYLVFQPKIASNWTWGVKIRSISATEQYIPEVSYVHIAPQLAKLGEETELHFTVKDQMGVDMTADLYTVSVSENATFENGKLTINSGNKAIVTVSNDESSVQTTIYVPSAPEAPKASNIATPIFTNTVTDYNDTVDFTTAYNGGAVNVGTYTFSNGEIAQEFYDARCVFFSNSMTTGVWNADLDPSNTNDKINNSVKHEQAWGALCLDVYGTDHVEGFIEFESVAGKEGLSHNNPFTLLPGEWNHIVIDVKGATLLGNLSIRFNAANACTVLLTNIYFTPADVKDVTAPVLDDLKATSSLTSITLHMYAADDLANDLTYTIKEGDNTYTVIGQQSEPTDFTVTGLDFGTKYTFTVVANDGTNNSAEQTITVSTIGLTQPVVDGKYESVFTPSFTADGQSTTAPSFNALDSSSEMTVLTNSAGQSILSFTNFSQGELTGLNIPAKDMTAFHIDIFSETSGTIHFELTWTDEYNSTTTDEDYAEEDMGYAEMAQKRLPRRMAAITKDVEVNAGEWTSQDLATAYFFDNGTNDINEGNKTITGIKMTSEDLPSFNVGNIYFANDANTPTGVEVKVVESNKADIYTLQGICVARGVNPADAAALPAGLYIVKTGSKTYKLLVK